MDKRPVVDACMQPGRLVVTPGAGPSILFRGPASLCRGRFPIVPAPMPIYYTRCPVPTASGIAFQRGMFAELFRESGYEVLNLSKLGPRGKDVHYTHSVEAFFREGGGAPPVWARANGVDSVVLGITFMEELLGIFVRADDPAGSVADLAGRLVILDFWTFC